MTASQDDELVRMANQIASFFAPYPRAEAEAGVAKHIVDFWDPRMRAALADRLAKGGAGLDPLALAGARIAVRAATGAPETAR